MLVPVLLAPAARADINPWVASNLYNPEKWDTAGPDTGTPWLHPPTWTPNQEWGVLSGKWRTTGGLTGSWGGARDKLALRGVQIVGGFFGQFAANPVGGERQGSSWKGDPAIGLFLDLERLVGWQRGYVTTSIAHKTSGDSLSPDHIGNQFPVQLDSGASHGDTRLVHMAFGQQLLDNKAELALGRIIAGDDFAALQLACTSLNQAICGNPIAANQSISFPTFPASTWGGRIKVKADSNWYAQTGAYLVYPKLFEETNDFGEFGAPDGSGVLALGEFGYLVGKNGGGQGLPGTYKLGGYYDSERLTDLDSGDSKRGTWGLYGMAQQMLYAENGKDRQGLSAFLALSYAPPDVNRIQFMAAGGLSYQGAPAVPMTPSLSSAPTACSATIFRARTPRRSWR